MDDKQVKNNKHFSPRFETAAINDIKRSAGAGRVPVPSEAAVKDAKDWVDENEK